VDGGKARIILHCLVTPGEVMENQPFLGQFRRTLFRPANCKLKAWSGVLAYHSTIDIIGAIEGAGIRMYTPLLTGIGRTPTAPTSRCIYDAEQDVYRCHRVRRSGCGGPMRSG